MTGKELIKYILDNDLENEPVFQNGTIVGYTYPEKVAEKYDVGVATVKVWYQLGAIDGFSIGDRIFIAENAKPRIREGDLKINISSDMLRLYLESQKESELS